ncbi:MAG TPA: AAA family ATPase [Candidatus Sulfotelmatobacter sp.]|jgi:predicted ATPase|nr:AAA family ATPase [Candidatus Sulfotelmatobacter sp.]
MQLESFRIQNYRSITDSGDIKLSHVTALLGRNESGKSNLLLGLRTLNPTEGFKALNPTKDFPRHRRLTECSDDTGVVSSSWKLTSNEQKELAEILPRAGSVTHVQIGRTYGAKRWVSFQNLPPLEFDKASVQNKITKIVASVKVAGENLEEARKTPLEAAVAAFSDAAAVKGTKEDWAVRTSSALTALRQAIARANATLPENQEKDIVDLEQLCPTISGDQEAQQRARNWATAKVPKFIYLADYPELAGHQNISQYMQRKAQNQQNEADKDFAKLCKVAGLDPARLNQLQGEEKSEERNQIANRASAVVTAEIRRLWKDRPLKVRFNLDAAHFDTLISDPTSTFDVEVNLDERSRGFRWFFSFYITFSADTDGGAAKDAILLLDEPGLYLHIQSQKDLLAHWEKDFDNQIVYTTHSPFMIPIQALDCLRTVNISEEDGTTVTNDPTGDGRTLAPIRAALGYFYADTLFIGPNNLIVEGVTDWWILEAVSKHFTAAGKSGLAAGLSVCPVDGAPKVPTMVSMLTAQHLNALVLFDDEKQARTTRDEIVASKLIREGNITFVSEAFSTKKPSEADIEDLIDAAVYESLVRESYARELKGKTLKLNSKIPRIVKRFEAAFEELGLAFHKTRPAGLFFRKMATDPASVMTPESVNRFEALFAIINERLQKSVARDAAPFH